MSEKVGILTHTDVDGVCSAALARTSLPNARVEFTEAYQLASALSSLSNFDKIVVMDLGINPAQKEEVLKAFEKVCQSNELLYVDHHKFSEGVSEGRLSCDTIIHEEDVSASELALNYFEPPLLLENVALMGAIGDYQEDTSQMEELLLKHGERISRLETILLEQGVGASRDDPDYLRRVVDELSGGSWPSDIPRLMQRARSALESEREVKEHTSENFEKMNEKVALIKDVPYKATGRAATYALKFAGTDLGVAIYRQDSKVRISMRRKDGSEIDLNEIITEATLKLEGTGGGHEAAVGGRIPEDKFGDFLDFLDEKVN